MFRHKLFSTKIFKIFDLFNGPISIPFKQHYYYNTSVGGLLTLLIIIFFILYTTFNLKILFNKESYTIISNELDDSSDIIDFSEIPFGFTLTHENGTILEYDPKIYEFKILDYEQYYYFNETNNNNYIFKSRNIEFDQCEKFLNYSKSFNIFVSRYKDNKLFCIKPNQNLKIYGKYGDIIHGFKGFRIYINKCDNKTNNCYDLNFINNKLASSKLFITYLGQDLGKFDNPKHIIRQTLYSDILRFSTYITKKYYYTFKKLNYVINNKITDFKTNVPFFIYEKLIFDFDYDLNNDNINYFENAIGYSAFHSAGVVLQYNKKYPSFSDIITKIGGIFNIIITFSSIINNYFSKKILLLDIYYFLYHERHKNIKPKSFNILNDRLVDRKKISSARKVCKSFKIIPKMEEEPRDIFKFKQDKSPYESNLGENSINLIIKRNNDNIKNFNSNNIKIGNNERKKRKNFPRLSMVRTFISRKKPISKRHLVLYYLCSGFCLKQLKTTKFLYDLEKDIYSCFSIENFLKLILIQKKIANSNNELLSIK